MENFFQFEKFEYFYIVEHKVSGQPLISIIVEKNPYFWGKKLHEFSSWNIFFFVR